MTPKILIGTASWTDPTLIKSGRFYPREARTAEGRLRFYAENFPIVEVDSSYYALPSYRNAELWAERTPDEFVFNLKVFRFFTHHQTQPNVLPRNVQDALGDLKGRNLYYPDAPAEIKDELWRQFALSHEPLVRAGKLGALLFQFPKWFLPHRGSFDHLREIRARLGADALIAVEFRHESWFSDSIRDTVLKFEREMRFCNVIVDEPQLSGSIPTVWEVTHPDLAILRLHGRNAATWNIKGAVSASERFNYDYSDAELATFLPPLRSLASEAQRVHVIFNNNLEDQGVRNARALTNLLFP